MNHIYIIIYVLSIVLASVFTVIVMERKSIMQKWVDYKEKRVKDRDKHLKSIVKQMVLEYLKELSKNEANKDDNNSSTKKLQSKG